MSGHRKNPMGGGLRYRLTALITAAAMLVAGLGTGIAIANEPGDGDTTNQEQSQTVDNAGQGGDAQDAANETGAQDEPADSAGETATGSDSGESTDGGTGADGNATAGPQDGLSGTDSDNGNMPADAGAANGMAKAEPLADSSSEFTITWTYDSYYGDDQAQSLTVTCYDDAGNPLSDTPESISLTSDEKVVFSEDNDALDIPGYTFDYAVYSTYNGHQRKFDTLSATYNRRYWSYTIDGQSYNYYGSPQVSLYYTEDPVGLRITDTIATNGRFNAVLNSVEVPEGGAVEYTWYRSLTGENNTWDEVTLQRVTGTQDNLVNDGQSVNVAYDSIAANAQDGDRYWYYVTATVKGADGNDVETYTADPVQVPYYIELQNGSFENPVIRFWNDQLPNGTDRLVWQTTGEGSGTHDGADIELVRSTDQLFYDSTDYNRRKTYQQKAKETYSQDSADDGVQYAELNCEEYGALYQDVLTVPGANLNWYLSHSARQGSDTMALVIMPVAMAENLTDNLESIANSDSSSDQSDQKASRIRQAIDGYQDQDGVYIQYITDGTVDWGHYRGRYTVGEDQYLTRFFFVAVSTGSNNATVGNLLDHVGFGSDIPEPDTDQGVIAVRKVVQGYVPESGYSVNVTITDEDNSKRTLTLDSFTVDSSTGDYVAEDYIDIDDMTAHTSETFTVEEAVTGAPQGYEETSTVAVGEGEPGVGKQAVATVDAGGTTTVVFTNSYLQNSVTIPGLVETKTVKGGKVSAGEFRFTAQAVDGAGTTADQAATVAGWNSGTVGYDAGTHTLSSGNPALDGTEAADTVDVRSRTQGLTFTTSDANKTYTYVYREDTNYMPAGWHQTDATLQGTSSSAKAWKVEIAVENTDGQLHATVSVYAATGTDGDGNPTWGETAASRNIYKPGDDVSEPIVIPFVNEFAPVSSLPLTGGDSTARTLLLAGGGVLLVAGAAWLLARRRQV